MKSPLASKHHKSGPSAPCALWPVDLKLTHLDWNPEATLIHFQGQYLTICDLDYNILQGEIQTTPKTNAAIDIGEFCLVEDLSSGRWHRGRVQNRKRDLFDVFLIDHGNVLSVDVAHISTGSNDLFILPPKIVCGFLANVLLIQVCTPSVVELYLSSLIGRNVAGYIQALLPHKVLLLEAPDINADLFKHGFGKHVDTDTFLLLVGMITEAPLKQNIGSVPDLLIEKPRGQELYFRTSGFQGYEEILSLSQPRLTCGTRLEVRVTAAVNPALFYCQKTSMETDLWEMSKKLATANECRNKEQDRNNSGTLGLLCSVKGKDGKWYRGFVKDLPVNSQLRVLFLDYGYFETVKLDNVCRLPSNVYFMPIMAFPCSLYSQSVQDEAVKTQQLSLLKTGLLGRVLQMEIRDFDEEQHLYSVVIIGAEDNHGKKLEPIQDLPSIKALSASEEKLPPQRGPSSHYDTIMAETLRKSLDVEQVHMGSVFVGYIEHVQDPGHFWIRTQKRNEEFEEMMVKVSNNFSDVKLEEDVLSNPEPGTLCCAVYEKDMHFYRGIVTDILEHGSEVLFIDFGNIEKVPHMLVKKIPQKLATKSAFAFCCTLVNVFPMNEVWTSDTSDFFRHAVSNRALLVHVVQIRKGKCAVDLRYMGSDDNQSVTELLIASKQADHWNNVAIETVVPNHTDMTKITPERLQDHDTERIKSPASFKALSIKPGCNFAVRCSAFKSPWDFWCQPLAKLPALEELMREVNQYYSTHTVPLQLGDPCCVAKSPEDGRWYRAFIRERMKGHTEVMLVDYGSIVHIHEHDVQMVLPKYVRLEGQAFRCSLHKTVKPADPQNDGDWIPEVCKSLRDLILASDLRCEIVSQMIVKKQGLCNAVQLYDSRTQRSINDMLSAQGLTRQDTISATFPESFVYSSFKLRPGTEEQVYVTHVGSQWEVYCQLERNFDLIKELENKISEAIEKMMQTNMRAVVRKLFLAKYFDGKWYRGLALPVQSLLHSSVFFVDYGNTSISEKAHIMCIPRDCADLLHTPMQAVKCQLVSVSKEKLYVEVKEWLDGTILNKHLRVSVVSANEDGSFDIELFDGDININTKVKELILRLSPKPKTVVSFERSKCKSFHTGKMRGQRGGCSFPVLNNFRSRAVNAPCIRKVNTKSHIHRKPQNTAVKQQRENHDTKVKQPGQDRTNTTHPCLLDVKVSSGLRVECYVAYINSINSFFLQLSEDGPAILKMEEDLNSSTFKDFLKTPQSLGVGDFVLAEYEDGALYRSAVKGCEESSCFRVEFVDYGNSAVLDKKKIYSLPKEYLAQPRFSTSCSLLDTSAYEDDTAFADAVMDKPLVVHFVCHHENHWTVEVLDGAVGLTAAPELATESEMLEGPSADSPEPEEKVRPSEHPLSPEQEPLIIQAQDTETSTVLSILSNGNFYARLNKSRELLTGLERSLADNLHKCKVVAEEDLKQGLECLVQGAEDEQWHRAVVQDTSWKECRVLLVDLGITRKILSSSVPRQCSELAKIQHLAILCNCKGGDAHKLLQPIIGKEVQLVFVCYSETDQLWTVEVLVNRLVLSCQVTTDEQQNDKVVPLPEQTDLNLDLSPPQQLTFAPIHIDEAYSGFAATVTTPFEFCIILEDLLLVMNKVSIMLDDPARQTCPLPQAHLVPGTCCLLQSVTKNKWCRAEIIHVGPTAMLNLVDYSHHECVLYEDCGKLMKLPEELTNVPKMTYPCVLRGVKPVRVDGLWSDEAVVFFQQCLNQENLQVIFKDFVSNTHWKVDVLTHGVHVAKRLVDAGHADYVDIMLGLRFHTQSQLNVAPSSPDNKEECGEKDEGSCLDLLNGFLM